jgi:hypothetical protein
MAGTSASTNNAPGSEPVISDEADRALRLIIMIGLPLTLALCFLIPLGTIYLGALFPKNHFIAGQQSPLAILSYFVWMVPAYFLFAKVYKMRLEFGRKYVGEERWKLERGRLRARLIRSIRAEILR